MSWINPHWWVVGNQPTPKMMQFFLHHGLISWKNGDIMNKWYHSNIHDVYIYIYTHKWTSWVVLLCNQYHWYNTKLWCTWITNFSEIHSQEQKLSMLISYKLKRTHALSTCSVNVNSDVCDEDIFCRVMRMRICNNIYSENKTIKAHVSAAPCRHTGSKYYFKISTN